MYEFCKSQIFNLIYCTHSLHSFLNFYLNTPSRKFEWEKKSQPHKLDVRYSKDRENNSLLKCTGDTNRKSITSRLRINSSFVVLFCLAQPINFSPLPKVSQVPKSMPKWNLKDGTHTHTHTQVPVHDTAEMYHSNLSFENKTPSAKKKRER